MRKVQVIVTVKVSQVVSAWIKDDGLSEAEIQDEAKKQAMYKLDLTSPVERVPFTMEAEIIKP